MPGGGVRDDKCLQADAAEVLAVAAPDWHLDALASVGTDETDLVLSHLDLRVVAPECPQRVRLLHPPLPEGLRLQVSRRQSVDGVDGHVVDLLVLVLVLAGELGPIETGYFEADEVLAQLELIGRDGEVLLPAVLAVGVTEEGLEVADGVLLVVDIEGALHGPAERGVFGKESPDLHGEAQILVGEGELEVEDVDVLEDGEGAEEALHQDFPHLDERVQRLVEAAAALVELSPVRLPRQAVVHEGAALEASEPYWVLGLAETGEGALLLVEVLDDGIGPVGGDVLLHDVLLLLGGCRLHRKTGNQ